jgi:hypothetical protein
LAIGQLVYYLGGINMVQVLPKVRTFGEEFGAALGGGLGKGVSQGLEQRAMQKKQMADLAKENQEIEDAYGIKMRSTAPEARKAEFAHQFKLLQMDAQNKAKMEQEQFKQDLKFQNKNKFIDQLGLNNLDSEEGRQTQNEPNAEIQTPDMNNETKMDNSNNAPKKKNYGKLIPQEKIYKASLVEPALADKMQKHNDTILKQQQHDEDITQKAEQFEYKKGQESLEHQRDEKLNAEQAKSDSEFYNDLNQRRSKQILKKDSIERLEKINKKGVTGKAYEKVLERLGLTSQTSSGRRELSAEVKNQFTDFKQIAGSQLSASEFFVLTGAYPNADFSQEANQAIIDNIKIVHDTFDKEDEIAEKLIKENKGKIPERFQAKVNEEMQKYISSRSTELKNNLKKVQYEQLGIPKGHTLLIAPDGGDLSVPDGEVDFYIEKGASLP